MSKPTYSIMCGCFQSATSQYARLLTHHPQIIYTDELQTFRNIAKANEHIKALKSIYPAVLARPKIPICCIGPKYNEFLINATAKKQKELKTFVIE